MTQDAHKPENSVHNPLLSASDQPQDAMEEICLQSDTGAELVFTGAFCKEYSFYDDERSTLTRMRLYSADNGDLVYSVVSSDGKSKERRAYRMSLEGENVVVNNGFFGISVDTRHLTEIIRGLLSMGSQAATQELVDDLKKAMNG